MKFSRVLITFLVVVALIMSIVSAENAEKNSDGAAEALSPTNEFAPNAAYTITQDETDYHTYYVPPNSSTLYIDLNWFTYDYSLTLGIYRPDGAQYGYYHDLDDGDYANGRISIKINTPASGSWTFSVYGEDVTGTQPYVISVGSNRIKS